MNRAWLVDLIHSIGEKLALCDHLAEKLDDTKSKELYLRALEARRSEMQLLVDNSPNPNLEYWCAFKHAVKSYVLAMEVYDAEQNDQTLSVALNSADILAGITSLFLGYEFKVCSRCLLDNMLANNKKKGV